MITSDVVRHFENVDFTEACDDDFLDKTELRKEEINNSRCFAVFSFYLVFVLFISNKRAFKNIIDRFYINQRRENQIYYCLDSIFNVI